MPHSLKLQMQGPFQRAFIYNFRQLLYNFIFKIYQQWVKVQQSKLPVSDSGQLKIFDILNFIFPLYMNKMQLLKLASNYPSPIHQPISKQNLKNYYLNILQKCIHVPKDDRLVLRKYLSSQLNLNEQSQVVNLLLKYAKGKGKENKDQKLQVLLRKQADKLRKDYQTQIFQHRKHCHVKYQNKEIKDTKKFCSNFQMLKNAIRMPLSRKSNSRVTSVESSPAKIVKCFKENSKPFYKIKQKADSKCSSMKSSIKSYEKMGNKKKSSNERAELKRSSQIITSTKSYYPKKKACRNTNKYFQKENTQLISTPDKFTDLTLEKKHKHTRSRSLGNLIPNCQEEQKTLKLSSQINDIFKEKPEPFLHTFRSQQIQRENYDLSNMIQSRGNLTNSFIYNFSSFKSSKDSKDAISQIYSSCITANNND